MRKLKRLFAAAAAMVLAFVGASASAAEIKLTMTSWDSLKNAVKNASAGDVISVTPVEGKYGEGEYYTAESTIKFNKSLTIMSASTSKPLKIYNGTTRLPVFEIFSGAADVTLEKIVFSGSDASTAMSPQRGTIVSTADKLRLSYCTFDGCTAAIGSSTSGYAGAVKASGSLLIMNDCVFKDCRVINHVGADIPSLGGGNHFAGAVSTTAKETLVSRCSFIGNEIKGFKGVTDFMAKNMGAAIVAGDSVTPTGEKPPVLTIMNSSFARNCGSCTVFAANEGLRIISSTFVDNGPASDNTSRGGRAVRFWHTKDYASAYQWTGNLYIVNSVFLGNWEGDTYLDINYYTDTLPVYAYYSLFSKDTNFGWPGVGCKFLSAAESVAWYDFFLNSDNYTGSVPVVTTLLGVDHYAYPLSPRAYESGYKVAYNLYYKVEDTTPWVYGYGGSASSMVWAGFGTCPELADRPIQNAGVDRQYCYRSEGGNRTYLPSCGSAASYPSVVKFQKNKTGAAVYDTVTAMWNYEKVTMPENDYEETGYTFKRWECNGKTYEPGEEVDVKDLSTQCFGAYRPDETIVVAPVYEAKGYRVYFQTYEDTKHVLSSYITATYYQPVTIRAPKDSVYDGYTVEGWATSKERAAAGKIDVYDGATFIYNRASDTELYWVNRKPNTATYSFKKNSPGGSTEFIIGDEFTMTVTTGGAQMVPTCPFVYPGYRFKCWFTGDNDENREDFYPGDGFGKVSVDGSTVPIYADWEYIGNFAIQYNPNGGVGEPQMQLVYESDLNDRRLGSHFSKADCTLVGWSKDPNCQLTDWFYRTDASVWDVAEEGVSTIQLYAVWQDNAGSLRTCPTGEGDISLLIEIIDPVKKTARLVNVLSKTGILSNWTIPDTATSSDKTVWTIVEYGYLTLALAGVPEITIGKFVTDGALCLQGDLGGNTRTKIHVPAANTAYASIDGLLVSKDKKHLLAVPCAWDNEAHTLEIPEGIETIESGSCWSLKNVKTVIIPSTVCTMRAVKTGSFGTETQGQNWGPSPFSGKGISQFYFRGNFSPAYMESPDVFYATSWGVQTCPPIIRDDLHAVIGFISHPSRDPSKGHTCEVVVPEGVTAIYDSAFEACSQMTSLTLPSTLESIGKYAFYNCPYLPSVDVPAAVEYIGDGAFACCGRLAEVTGGAGLGMNSVGYDVLGSTKVSETADENGTAAKIGSILVYQGDNGSLPKTLEVESDVTGIAGGAFCQLSGVETVKLPASVAWIGENAFEECEGLVRIRHFIGTDVNNDFAGENNKDLCELEIYGSADADTIGGYMGWEGFGNGDITLVIGSGIKTIEAYTFNRSSPEGKDIWEVLGGDDLEWVSRDAFTGTYFADSENNTPHRAIGTFYVGYFGSAVSIEMPNENPGDGTKQLKRVSSSAFRTLTTAKTLRFGKYIDAEQLTGSMFQDLVALNSYAIDPTAANYATDTQGILYNKAMTKIIAVPKNLAGTVNIPTSVTEIGESAFADCSQLKSIIGGGNVVNIGEHAFDNCPANPFKDMASVRIWDCAFNLVQTIPGTTLKPVDLPHPTNLAAVVDSIPYGTWPVSGEWYCSNDDKNYKDSFQPKVAGEYYDLKPALQDVMGDYSIAYDKNAEDATGTMDPQIEGIGYLTTLDSNVFVRPGYTFKGWNTMSDGSGASFGDGEMVYFDWPDVFAGDTVTLYAQWSDKPAYTLAFDGASEYATDVPSPMTGFVGEYVTIPSATPSREGWAFDAWTDASRSQRWTAGYEYFVLDDWEISAGETYTLYALWTEGSDNGTYTDAQGTEWHYGRNGDEIGITYVKPGPSATYPLTMPTTIKGGTVNVAKSIKLPVMIGKIWWNWKVIDEDEKTCGLTYPILGSGEKLPDDVVLPEQIEGYALIAALFEDSFADGANVRSVTIHDNGEPKTIWAEYFGGAYKKIHVPGAAPVDWTCSLRNLFYSVDTCCYDPDETSWTAYKAAHAEEGIDFVAEGTYTIRFDKNAADATGTMPDKVCVIGRTYPALEGTEWINYTRPGWNFVDWFRDPGCTVKAGLGGEFWNLSTTPDDVVTVYAKWSQYSPKAVIQDAGKTLRFVYDDENYGKKGVAWFAVDENEAIDYEGGSNIPQWNQDPKNQYEKIVFDPTFKDYRPRGCQCWFCGCDEMTAIEGIENLDTSSVTNMACMFTSCGVLASVDLSGFDTKNVRDMSRMFLRCSTLTSLDLRSFDTAKVVDMDGMFYECTNLAKIDATDAFTTEALTKSSDHMFVNCTKLVGSNGTTYDAANVNADFAHIDGGTSDPGYFSGTYVPPVPKVMAKAVLTDEGQTLIFVYDDVNYGVKGTDWFSVAEAEAEKAYNAMPWQGCAGTVTTVAFGGSFKSYKPKHCGSWFWDFTKLTTVVAMENLDTSEATSLCQMFSGCSKLASLDLSWLDTAKVEQMYQMFFNCSELTTILASESFTTASVLDSSNMFKGCTKLVGGNGTTYDATKVDATYARIDKAGTPGYFTDAVEPPEPETVTVTFDANGGTVGEEYRYVEKGEAVGPLPTATAAGKVFLGWFNAKDGGVQVTEESPVLADITLFAHWDEPAADEYVVVFNGNGGTASAYYRFVKQNAAVGTLPTAEREDFNFVGWFTELTGGDEVTASTAVTGHSVYHAHWTTKSGETISVDDTRVAFAAIPDQVYAGGAAEPPVEMTFNGNPCVEGSDFEVEYVDNGRAGTASVIVTGIGNFSGEKTLTFNILPIVKTVGHYLEYDLEEDLGVMLDEIDGVVTDYKQGDKATVKIEGLAKGLKLAQDRTTQAWILSGVPTETALFKTQPMFARATVTYKDRTKGVNGKAEKLYLLPLDIVADEVRTLTAGVLSTVFSPVDIATLWPEVADAKANPKDWTIKGWPSGILYNNTAADKAWTYKDPETGTQVKTVASPYEVYGLPTKAGTFALTATHKYKPAGSTVAVSETFSATMTVWADADEMSYRYTDRVGVEMKTVTTNASWKSVAGQPAGIKWTLKDVAANPKAGTPAYPAYSLYGTPTKAGVYATVITKVDPKDAKKTVKETFLWKVAAGANDGILGKIGWAGENSYVTVMQGVVQNWAVDMPAGAKVTVTAPPAGLKLAQDKASGKWFLSGTPTKEGNYVVTFKTVLNGETVTERIAIVVEPNEWTGNWYGVQRDTYKDSSLNILVNVAANGTVKLTLQEGVAKMIVKTSVTAKKLNADGHTVTLNVMKGKDVLRTFTVDFAANTFAVGGTVVADLYETTVSYAEDKSILTFVLDEIADGETNAYAYVTATYDAKKAAFTLSGKLWDGTAVKGTAYPLDKWAKMDGNVLSPVLLTDKAKNSVYLELSDDGSQCRVLENGEKISIGKNGTTPWMDYYLAAELKGKTFANLVPEATSCVVLADDGEVVIDGLTTKELGTKLAANGLAKLTLTDKFGWKWVCEMLPVDNNDETQFRGIATGTKKGETTQYAPVWSK